MSYSSSNVKVYNNKPLQVYPSSTQGTRLRPTCNPLSPRIHIQILQTDRHTFPLRTGWENLIKHQGIFSFVIIFYILTTLSLDNVWTLLGENCCWSLLGLKGLKGKQETPHSFRKHIKEVLSHLNCCLKVTGLLRHLQAEHRGKQVS